MEEPLLDRQLLERLERLTLRWGKSFSGIAGGHNLSRFPGAGQEFLEHRNFHQGDDLRSINWRAYMRFEKLFLKMFQVEPRVPVRFLVDVSKSMSVGHGANEPSKHEYARQLAAALTYVGLVRLDSILLQPFSNKLYDPFPASGGRHRFQGAEQYLRGLKPFGATNYLETARQFLNTYPQRGLVLIFSDFLDEQDCLKPLQYMADFGHELLLIQIWGAEDREPSELGEVDLTDAESGEHLKLAIDEEARTEYTRRFDAYRDELRTLALRNGGRFFSVPTNMSIEAAAFGSLTAAQAR